MTVSDLPTLDPNVPPSRQCGRCREWFPSPEADTPGTIPDWWLCPPCHDALIPGSRTGRTGGETGVDDAELGFLQAAAEAGYDARRAHQMVDATKGLALPLDVAAVWLTRGYTPWAATVWLTKGFDAPEDADRYRAMGLDAEQAYWHRFDRRTGRAAPAAASDAPR